MSYRITRKANADIEAICDFIARDNPGAANRLDEQFHREMQKLPEMPGMGHQRRDVANPRYRFWSIGNYVIAYRLEKGAVIVSRVIHGARDFRRLFHP